MSEAASIEFRSWLAEWSRAWNVPELSTRTRIVPSPRLRRSLGRCYPTRSLIRFNPRLLAEPEPLLREVLCHEAAHLAVHVLHGREARPHGAEWAGLMRIAGFEPRARFDPARLTPRLQSWVRGGALYVHRCPVCCASRTARRPVRSWHCRRCADAGLDAVLEIVSRPAG
jgi:predicted SprT family Zn-dependent metalloprotease